MNDFKVGDLVYIEAENGERLYRIILDLTPKSRCDIMKVYYLNSNTISMVPKTYIRHRNGYKKAV